MPGMSTKRRTLATRRGGGVMVSVVGTATPSGAGHTMGDEGEDYAEGTTTAVEMELAQRTTGGGGGNEDAATKQDALVMQSCDGDQCCHSCGQGRESFRGGGGGEMVERNQTGQDHPVPLTTETSASPCGLAASTCHRPVPNEDETLNGCEGGKKLGGEVERV